MAFIFICVIMEINFLEESDYMVKEIMHDPIFLGGRSEKATKEDVQVAKDLLDTLAANKDKCVGMAANMIGIRKRIIVFDNEGTYVTMFNPEIIAKAGEYEAQEFCLSLLGGPRKAKRYISIKVQWQDADFKLCSKTFVGWPAQIIQHEIDHCNGVLI